jgi:PAS domain S-box-containing protein
MTEPRGDPRESFAATLERGPPAHDLAQFIRENESFIIQEWEQALRALPVAQPLPRPALLDHVPDLLSRLAESLDEVAQGMPPRSLDHMTDQHALARLDEGFDLQEVVMEYGVLRATIERLWEEAAPERVRRQIRVLDRTIDLAVAASVKRYTHARERALVALDRISAAALSHSGDPYKFLTRLLGVLLETTESVDTTAILLRDGDVLRVRAAVGLEQEVSQGFSLRIGEGFAGKIADKRAPLELSGSAIDEVVKSPILRARGLRALYGVPLMKNDELIGIAHMGSRTAFHFSEESKLLFRMMANRATAFITQAETQALLDTLLAASPIGIAFIDKNLKYVRINDALAAVNGRPAQEHLGRTIREVLPEVADLFEPMVQKILDSGEPILNLEFSGSPPSTPGQVRHFLANYYPVRGSGGDVIGVGGIVVEITDRKLVEARLRKALSIETVGVLFFNLGGQMHDANRALERMSGYSSDQLRSMSWQSLTPPEFADLTARAAAEIASTGETPPYEKQWIRPDGSRWWGLFAPTRLSGSGRDSECVEFIIDSTQRKQAEEALSESELQFRTLADNIPQLTWMMDEKGSAYWYNRRWFEFTGTTMGEMKGGGWQRVHHPDHVERVTHKFRNHLERGEAWEDTFPLRGEDGSYRWFLSRAIPIRNDTGKIVRWFGTNTDVTELRDAEEALHRAATFREQFIGILGHDLRNPLGAIMASAQMLYRPGNLNEPQSRAVHRIVSSAEKMQRMINDVLDFARARLGGGISVKRERMNLHEVCRQAIDELHVVHPKRKIEFIAEGDGDGCWDRDRLAQVVGNLVANAINYGSKDAAIQVRSADLDGEVQFNVTNQGKPIPAELIPVLFEPLSRGVAESPANKSLGLGLHIVKLIVDAHGGRVDVRSTEAEGTTFTVTLPSGLS